MVAVSEVILKAAVLSRGKTRFFIFYGKYCPSHTQSHSLCWHILSTKGFKPHLPPPPRAKSQSLCCKTKDPPAQCVGKIMQLTFHTPHTPKAGLRRSDQRTAPQLPSISNQPCFASERTMQTAPVPYCAFLTSQRNHALIIFFFKKANVVIQEKALLQEPILMASPILKQCPVCPQKSALETTGAGPVTGFLRSPRRCLSLTVAPRLVGGEWLLSSLRAAVCRELRPAQRSAAQPSPAAVVGAAHGVAAACV